MDFDEWKENPYTKVLEASIATDYVPRTDLTAEREVSDKLEKALKYALKHIDPKAIDMPKWSSGKQPWHVNSIISAALAEVAAIRATHTNREQANTPTTKEQQA